MNKALRLYVKTVTYFGHQITVPDWAQWVAIDSDGLVYAYQAEPQQGAESWYIADKFDAYVQLGGAWLENIKWQETKAKV